MSARHRDPRPPVADAPPGAGRRRRHRRARPARCPAAGRGARGARRVRGGHGAVRPARARPGHLRRGGGRLHAGRARGRGLGARRRSRRSRGGRGWRSSSTSPCSPWLTLLTGIATPQSWTAYVLITASCWSPCSPRRSCGRGCARRVVVPAVLVYLVAGIATQSANEEPWASLLLRTLVIAGVGAACVGLSWIQRSRVTTIGRLVAARTELLAELTDLERRERRALSEQLHDGALQYVLAARQDLDEARDTGAPEAFDRLERGAAGVVAPAAVDRRRAAPGRAGARRAARGGARSRRPRPRRAAASPPTWTSTAGRPTAAPGRRPALPDGARAARQRGQARPGHARHGRPGARRRARPARPSTDDGVGVATRGRRAAARRGPHRAGLARAARRGGGRALTLAPAPVDGHRRDGGAAVDGRRPGARPQPEEASTKPPEATEQVRRDEPDERRAGAARAAPTGSSTPAGRRSSVSPDRRHVQVSLLIHASTDGAQARRPPVLRHQGSKPRTTQEEKQEMTTSTTTAAHHRPHHPPSPHPAPPAPRTAVVAAVGVLAGAGIAAGPGPRPGRRRHAQQPVATPAPVPASQAVPAAPRAGSREPRDPGPPKPAPAATPSPAIETLQRELGQLNYYEGPITGTMNNQTVARDHLPAALRAPAADRLHERCHPAGAGDDAGARQQHHGVLTPQRPRRPRTSVRGRRRAAGAASAYEAGAAPVPTSIAENVTRAPSSGCRRVAGGRGLLVGAGLEPHRGTGERGRAPGRSPSAVRPWNVAVTVEVPVAASVIE